MPCRDRLAELHHLAGGEGFLQDGLQMDPGPQPQYLHEIEELYHEVERTRSCLRDFNENTQRARRLLADPTFHNNTKLHEQLECAVSSNASLGARLGVALRALEKRTHTDDGCGPVGRAARLQCACLKRQYAESLRDQHSALDALRDQRLHLLQAQIKLTNLAMTDEECEALLDSNNVALFVDNLRAETAEARGALRAAEVRRDELAKVEAALREVRDLFVQLGSLVAAQQDHVDSVEYYALQTTHHVETGQQHLLKGKVSRTRAKKKKLSLILCLAVGGMIVLLVLVLT